MPQARRDRGARIALAAVVVAMVLAVAVQAVLAARPPAVGSPHFVLHDAAGGTVDPGRLHGRVALVFFGYTACPDVCPSELAWQRRVLNSLGGDAAGVIPVLVSVDPERDSPERLAAYAAAFDARILACTGSTAEIDAAVAAFGAGYRRQQPDRGGFYLVDHTATTFVLDRAGRCVDRLSSTMPAGEAAERIRAVLR